MPGDQIPGWVIVLVVFAPVVLSLLWWYVCTFLDELQALWEWLRETAKRLAPSPVSRGVKLNARAQAQVDVTGEDPVGCRFNSGPELPKVRMKPKHWTLWADTYAARVDQLTDQQATIRAGEAHMEQTRIRARKAIAAYQDALKEIE